MAADVKSGSSELEEPLERFVLWTLDALDIEVEPQADSTYQAQLPPKWRPAFGCDELTFRLDGDPNQAAGLLTTDSPLFEKIVSTLAAQGPVVHATPRKQPVSVHEISDKLFEAYTVENGRVRLSGCTLEARPFLRVTLRQSADRLIHLFTDDSGQPVPQSLQDDLGLSELSYIAKPARRVADGELAAWQQAGLQIATRHDVSATPLLVTVVWCKYTTGSLLFSIGRQSAEVKFDGWARRFADGLEKPPPYSCPLSNETSYHLALTDDQHLTVAEAIATCSESGRRVLRAALETCEATGRAALPDYMRYCPVSGQRVVMSSLEQCEMCHEQVSPTTLRRGRCAACRRMESVTKYEPRIVRLLGEYPGLDHWRRWKISETATTYIAVATSMLKRLLVVANKQSLEVARIATGTTPFATWRDCEPAQRDELLGTPT